MNEYGSTNEMPAFRSLRSSDIKSYLATKDSSGNIVLNIKLNDTSGDLLKGSYDAGPIIGYAAEGAALSALKEADGINIDATNSIVVTGTDCCATIVVNPNTGKIISGTWYAKVTFKFDVFEIESDGYVLDFENLKYTFDYKVTCGSENYF